MGNQTHQTSTINDFEKHLSIELLITYGKIDELTKEIKKEKEKKRRELGVLTAIMPRLLQKEERMEVLTVNGMRGNYVCVNRMEGSR